MGQVMDLEISNASLLAINKTLERELRKQAAELRRYKRLARAGRLSSATSISNLRKAEDAVTEDATESEADNASIADTELESEFGAEDEEDEDTETEQPSDEEQESEEGTTDGTGSEGANDEKHREADEKRLTWDLSKHQSLLDTSSKMNKSLRGCLFLTDQLINEAKKCLESRVLPSDIRIGGRILCDDEEDPDYYEAVEATDASAAEETEDEGFSVPQTEDEAEPEEPGVYHHRYFIPPELRPVRHSLV